MKKSYISNLKSLLSVPDVLLFSRSVLSRNESNCALFRTLSATQLKKGAACMCLANDYNSLQGASPIRTLKLGGKALKLCPFPSLEEALDFLYGKFPSWDIAVFCNDGNEAISFKKFIRSKNRSDKTKVFGFDSKLYWYDLSDSVSKATDEGVINPYPYFGGKPVTLPAPKVLNVTVPSLNDSVKTGSGKTLKLKKLLGAGNEGSIYSSNDPGKVIKILKPGRVTDRIKEKIEFMVANPINNPLVCWPIDSVYNRQHEFVGFVMPCVNGITLSEFMMQNESNPSGFGVFNVTKIGLIKIIISVLRTLCYLHKRNVLVGDIKLENFILEVKNGYVNYNNVYLLDTDSFQIGKFPATMVTEGYIAPEQEDCGKFYHTFGEENYSTFVLLFRLLFKDKKPYDQIQVTTDYTDREKAKMGKFPYSISQDETEKKCPPGYPPLCWSHLPSYVKKAFISVGSCAGENNAPEKRLSSFEWLEIFQRYKIHLSNGVLKVRDPDCNKGMPSCLNHDSPIDYKKVDIDFGEGL